MFSEGRRSIFVKGWRFILLKGGVLSLFADDVLCFLKGGISTLFADATTAAPPAKPPAGDAPHAAHQGVESERERERETERKRECENV